MTSRTTSSWSGSRPDPALTLLLLLGGCSSSWAPVDTAAPPDPVADVDPFIGTGGPGFRVGSSTPAATMPFGLVKLGPDTSMGGTVFGPYHCSGYYYDDDSIDGFSHLHLHGVGVPDYGNIRFMPTDGWDASMTGPAGYRRTFSHDNEQASPGYYSVVLDDGIRVELSATDRTGLHRYQFPTGARPTVVIDLEAVLGGTSGGGEVWLDPEAGTIEGWMLSLGSFTGGYGGMHVFFHAEVEGGFAGHGAWGDGAPTEGGTYAAGVDLGAWIEPVANPVTLRVGLSLTSLEGARRNLEAERPASLGEAVVAARAAWREPLERYRIEGATDEERAIFYTSVYHLLQMPTRQSDADGKYRGFDQAIHIRDRHDFYSDMSLWDTYRTAHPAYTLFHPEMAAAFADSLLKMRQHGGAFPRWPAGSGEGGSMLGAPADIVLAETWLKGVHDWDVDTAWPLLVAQARGQGSYAYNTRPDPSLLDRYGYYPSDMVGSSVAWNQEGAWADDALANLAQALGDAEMAAFFEHRSYTYVNQYDPVSGWFRARDSAGVFTEPFNEIAWEEEYTEGNAWQYLWMPPAHADTTAALFGGEDIARERLYQFMYGALDEGLVAGPAAYYWHGNEPDIHAPFLFSLWGDPSSAATWARFVEDERYFAAPDGLAGNDDAGTLSAWYLFSTLGFYPIAGTDQYILSAPRFPRASFALGEGEFIVERDGPAHVRGVAERVEGVWLDGVELTRPILRHHELQPGSTLRVKVSAEE